jgi:putative membrane protein
MLGEHDEATSEVLFAGGSEMSGIPISTVAPALGASHWTGRDWAHGGGAWWLAFPLLWLVVIAIVVTTFFVVMRRTTPRSRSPTAEAKLADRYAVGDITEDEYRERLAVLREQRQ